MSGNENLSLKGIKFDFSNLPEEIDLKNCKDENVKKILSVFDTDNKKGVLSKKEIINAIIFFAKNDKVKEEENQKYFEIGNDDAELIAGTFKNGKYFGRDIKNAFEFIKNAFVNTKNSKELAMRQEIIAPLMNEIEEKGLKLVSGKHINEILYNLRAPYIEEETVWFDDLGNVYKRNGNKLEVLEGVKLNLGEKWFISESSRVSDDYGGTYIVNKGVAIKYNQMEDFLQVNDSNNNPIEHPYLAAKLLGLEPETERCGFLWLDERETGRFGVKTDTYGSSWYEWDSSENRFRQREAVFKYGMFGRVPELQIGVISGEIKRMYDSVSSEFISSEEYLLGQTEIVEENGKKVCKFKDE